MSEVDEEVTVQPRGKTPVETRCGAIGWAYGEVRGHRVGIWRGFGCVLGTAVVGSRAVGPDGWEYRHGRISGLTARSLI